jgi:hypothetical protein
LKKGLRYIEREEARGLGRFRKVEGVEGLKGLL